MDARGYDQVKKSSHIYLNNEESLFSLLQSAAFHSTETTRH